jgi:hypothetical protein
MRRSVRLILAVIAVLAGATFAGPAAALPPSPWTGTWSDGSAAPIVLTQTGTQITGTQPCPGTATLPGVTISGSASADGTTANFTYASTICTGTGGSFTGTMSADGRRVSGSGTTQFGTGFSFSWTYVTGGNEPRETPPPAPARPLCPGGPWSGVWSRTDGVRAFTASLVQRGSTLSGTGVDDPETMEGTISGSTASVRFRRPGQTGAYRVTLAPDLATLTFLQTEPPEFAQPVPFVFVRCAQGLEGVDLARTIPAPQTIQGGPTTIVAPGTVSITSLTRSKCVLVRVASTRPARILVSIFSGRRSIRLFGQKRVRFTAPGKRRVCITVPFRAHTFNIRTRLNVALGYVVGATPRRGERKPKPVIRRIRLVP